jgi:hypothetical protein
MQAVRDGVGVGGIETGYAVKGSDTDAGGVRDFSVSHTRPDRPW